MNSKAEEIEMQESKWIQESQVFLGGSQEWYHVTFSDKKTAEACAQRAFDDVLHDIIVTENKKLAQENAQRAQSGLQSLKLIPLVPPRIQAKSQYQSQYPDGTFFFRVHQTAFEKFKATYQITKKVIIYGQKEQNPSSLFQQKTALKSAVADDNPSKNVCSIS